MISIDWNWGDLITGLVGTLLGWLLKAFHIKVAVEKTPPPPPNINDGG